jgi:hypothetical protein
MPMGEMKKQAAKLKGGELDVLQLPRFRAGFRQIASDINVGIQRVVEKGGGTARKPADLESILGPVPAQPSMSAFSFPMNDPSNVGQVPNVPQAGFNPPQAPHQTGQNQRFGNAPPPQPQPSRPGAPPPPANSRPGTPGPGAPMAGFPNVGGHDRTMAMGNAPGGPPPPFNAPAPPGAGSHSATVAASPGAANKLGGATAPAFSPASQPSPATNGGGDNEEEQTMVAQPSADLIAATGGHGTVADPAAEWHQVYEEFLRTKRECNEPTDGLTFEKFQQTLKKNRDALMQRHGCKRVKFSVYVKEGRASLKATPVRD